LSRRIAANAADLVAGNTDPTIQFHLLAGQTHVSALFSPGAARMLQAWAARALNLSIPAGSSLLYLGGGLLGFLAFCFCQGRFLRELADCSREGPADSQAGGTVRFMANRARFTCGGLLAWTSHSSARSRLFEGDYLASYFLLAGTILLLLHPAGLEEIGREPGVLLSVAVGP